MSPFLYTLFSLLSLFYHTLLESCNVFLYYDHKRYPVTNKEPTEYSPLVEDFSREKRKRDDVAPGKKFKQYKLILHKSSSSEDNGAT